MPDSFDARTRWPQWISTLVDVSGYNGMQVLPAQILSERFWIKSKYSYRITLSTQELVDWGSIDGWQYLSSTGATISFK